MSLTHLFETQLKIYFGKYTPTNQSQVNATSSREIFIQLFFSLVTALRLSSYPEGLVELLGEDGRWGTLCGHYW